MKAHQSAPEPFDLFLLRLSIVVPAEFPEKYLDAVRAAAQWLQSEEGTL